MYPKTKSALHLVLFLMLAFSLNQCVSDPKTTTATQPTVINNTITVGLVSEAANLNPIISSNSNDRTVYRHILSSLMTYAPQTGKLVPYLIKAAPHVTDINEGKWKGGKQYTFEIRPEAQWGDGKPVLASDVAFTFKIIANPHVKTAWKAILDDLADIQIDTTNPRKFTIATNKCNVQQLENLSTVNVYPAHIYDSENLMTNVTLAALSDKQNADQWENDANLKKFAETFSSPKHLRDPAFVKGAGPYELTKYTSKTILELTKVKNWWGDALAATEPVFTANPKKIRYKVVPDVAAATAMLKDGELDLMAQIPMDDYVSLKESAAGKENLQFASPDLPIMYYFALNTKSPILSDKRVRKSIRHLIDMDQYIQENVYGLGARITSPYPQNKPFYNKNIPLPQLDFDKANALLDAAGWKDINQDGVREKNIAGKATDLVVEVKIRPQSVDGNRVLQILKQNAQKAGMTIKVIHKDNTAIFRQDVPKGEFDMIATGIVFTPSEYVNSIPYFHSKSIPPKGRNYTRFATPETDALLESIVKCTDEDTRNAAYLRFQEILDDECPIIYLFTQKGRIAINKRFDNVVTSPIRPGYFENYFIAK